MNVQFNTIQDKIKYALRDYTSVGRQSPLSFSFLTDEQVYEIHPERYAFYLQMLDALQDPNTGLLDRVLSIENKSRYARDQLQRTSKDIAKALRYLSLTTSPSPSAPAQTQVGGGGMNEKVDGETGPSGDDGRESSVLMFPLPPTGRRPDETRKLLLTSRRNTLKSIPFKPTPAPEIPAPIEEGALAPKGAAKEGAAEVPAPTEEGALAADEGAAEVPAPTAPVPAPTEEGAPTAPVPAPTEEGALAADEGAAEDSHKFKKQHDTLITLTPSQQATTAMQGLLTSSVFPKSLDIKPTASPDNGTGDANLEQAQQSPSQTAPLTAPQQAPLPYPADDKTKALIQTLNVLLQASSAPVKFVDPSSTTTGSQTVALTTPPEPTIQRQAGGSFYTDMLERVERDKGDKKQLEAITDEIDTHPVFNPENEEVSMTDRVIFIAVTFMIRGLVLFLIDWGINSTLITNFNRAFLYYALIYFTIFMLWVLLVNAGNDTENIPLKMAFYYVNWRANGVGRVLAHLAVQTFLIPIPFIVREPLQGAPDTATFEKRRAVYRVLSNFTFFVWVMTSIIALRY